MLRKLPKAVMSALFNRNRLPERSFSEEVMCQTLKGLFQGKPGQGINEIRTRMSSLAVFGPNIKKVCIEETHIAGVNCLRLTPNPSKTGVDVDHSRAMVYLHGGGYIMGSPKAYKALLADIATAANCSIIAPDYALAPEAKFPAAQNDCLAVAAQVMKEQTDKKWLIAGDSAGGALAIATAQGLVETGRVVDGLVLISPWVNPLAKGGSIDTNADHDYLIGPFLEKSFQALMQGQDLNDPRVNFTNADLSNLPRTLVQFGTGELFNDQIESFNQRALNQKVELVSEPYAAQCHVFHFFTAVSATSRRAVAQIGEFVRATA